MEEESHGDDLAQRRSQIARENAKNHRGGEFSLGLGHLGFRRARDWEKKTRREKDLGDG